MIDVLTYWIETLTVGNSKTVIRFSSKGVFARLIHIDRNEALITYHDIAKPERALTFFDLTGIKSKLPVREIRYVITAVAGEDGKTVSQPFVHKTEFEGWVKGGHLWTENKPLFIQVNAATLLKLSSLRSITQATQFVN